MLHWQQPMPLTARKVPKRCHAAGQTLLIIKHCRRDPAQWQRLQASATAAKERLSSSCEATAEVPAADDSWQLVTVTRHDFAAACAALTARAWAVVAELGRECRLSWIRSALICHAMPCHAMHNLAAAPGCIEQREKIVFAVLVLCTFALSSILNACREPGGHDHHQPEQAAKQAPAQPRYMPAPRRVDRVVLVGGSSSMPWVAEGLAACTGGALQQSAQVQSILGACMLVMHSIQQTQDCTHSMCACCSRTTGAAVAASSFTEPAGHAVQGYR